MKRFIAFFLRSFVVTVLSFAVFSSFAATLIVDDAGDGALGNTLRNQVEAAVDGDIIVFDAAIHGQTIRLQTVSRGAIDITEDIIIDGPANANIFITASVSPSASRLFDVEAGADATFRNITLNNVVLQTGSFAAAILNEGVLLLEEVVFDNLSAATVGAVGCDNGGELTVNQCHFISCQSQQGGAFRFRNSTGAINNTTFENCSAEAGSCVQALNNSNVTITNATMSGTVNALYLNGVVDARSGSSVDLNSVTIGRYAPQASTGIINIQDGGSNVSVLNCAIGENSNGAGQYGVRTVGGATFTSNGHNVIEVLGNPNGFTAQTGDRINTPPLFEDFGDNGGTLPTLSLRCNSPCVDGGTDIGTPVLDQRGEARLEATDIGAFELTVFPPNVVTNNNVNGAGSLPVIVLNACPDDTITFAEAVRGQTINLNAPGGGNSLLINKNLSIFGLGKDEVFISGGGNVRVFDVTAGDTLALKHLTINNGIAGGGQEGGAIRTTDGLVTIDSTIFRLNRARGGGAIASFNSRVELNEVCFDGENQGDEGGAIYNDGGTLIVTNVTFDSSQATNGAAINSIGGVVDVTNSTFTNNISTAGCIKLSNNAQLSLNSVTIGKNDEGPVSVGNTVGIFAGNSTINLINTIIGSNGGASFQQDGNGGPNNVISGGHNLIDLPNGLFTATATDIVGQDPNLVQVAANGGCCRTLALGCESPALNAGADAGTPTLDQRGHPRIGQTDIGAYESDIVKPEGSALIADAEGCIDEQQTFTFGSSNEEVNWYDLSNDNLLQADNRSYTHTITADITIRVEAIHPLGCIFRDTFNIQANPNPNADFTADEVCEGLATNFTDNSTNIDVGATYAWDFNNDGTTESTVANSTSFTYTTGGSFTAALTITNSTGCIGQTTETVTVKPKPVYTVTPDTFVCDGNSVDLEVQGGATYDWSTGETTAKITVSPNVATVYTVTVTGANGCTDESDINVTVGSKPNVNLGFDRDLCNGSSVDLDAGNFNSYNWSTGAVTRTISVNTPGNYSVTVTDNIGCEGTDDVEVNPIPSPSVDLGNDTSLCAGVNIILDANDNYQSYAWSNGSTNRTTVVNSGGTYSLTVTSINGCTASDDIFVTENANPNPNLGADRNICVGDSINLDAGAGFTDYDWSNGETTQIIKVKIAGTYAVEVTSDKGCVGEDEVVIGLFTEPQVDIGNPSFCGGATSVDIDAGNGFASYLWNSGETSQTITRTVTGPVSVEVVDNNGCKASDASEVTADLVVDINDGADTAFICNNSDVILNAGGGYATYNWIQTGATVQSISVNAPGFYGVEVSVGGGCTATDSIFVNNDNITVDLGPNTIDACVGETTTLMDITGTVGDYLWSTTQTTPTITIDRGGAYSLTVTNKNGCEASDQAFVAYNPKPIVNLGPDQRLCEDESVTLSAFAGAQSYAWSTGENTREISVNAVGNYEVTVTSNRGCTATDAKAITAIDPKPVPNDLGPDTSICAGSLVDLDAGAGFAVYAWSTGESTRGITVNGQGTYTVTVTNNNGCTASVSRTILNVFPNPTPNLGPDTSICEGTSITLSTDISYNTYNWTPGGITTPTIEVDRVGNYAVEVTDANGCIGSDSRSVLNVFANPTVELGGDSIQACAEYTMDAGPGFIYNWSPSGTNNQTFTATTTDDYQVIIFDNNSCSDTDAIHVTILPEPVINLGNDTAFCASDSITIDAGNTDMTYVWSTGATSNSIIAKTAGTYTVTVTGFNGCETETSKTITQNFANPVVPFPGDTIDICENGTRNLDAGPGAQSYAWNTGDATQTISISNAGTYTVTVTSNQGCSTTESINAGIKALSNLGPDTTVCVGEPVLIDANNSWISYSWSTGAMSQSIEPNTPDAYSVNLVSQYGCSVTLTRNVFNFAPTVVDLGPDIQACEGATFTLNAGNGFNDYTWSCSNSKAAQIMLTSGSSCAVTVTDANSCTASDDINYTFNGNPEVFIGANSTICDNETKVLNAGVGPDYLYSWNTGETEQRIEVSSPGSYEVTVTNKANCSATASTTISTIPAPNANITANPGLEVCQGEQVELSVAPGMKTYKWSNLSSTNVSQTSAEGPITVNIEADNGCKASSTVEIVHLVTPNPQVQQSWSCEGDETYLTAGIADNYEWMNGAVTKRITLKSGDLNNYAVTVSNKNGCVAESKGSIQPPVVLGLELESDRRAVVAGKSVELFADITGTTGEVSIFWTPDDQLSCVDCDNPTAIVTEDVVYKVRVIDVRTKEGNTVCELEDTISIEVITDDVLITPSAFSPNGDGVNDEFRVLTRYAKSYTLRIYNRWGDLVFETLNPDEGWDGTYMDLPVPMESYMYQVHMHYQFPGEENKELIKEGMVTLIR